MGASRMKGAVPTALRPFDFNKVLAAVVSPLKLKRISRLTSAATMKSGQKKM
jgi:hypothetical protein